MAGLPQSVSRLFAGLVFCSVRCVRAQFLETLCTLDDLDRLRADDIVSDLRATYLKLAMTFATILERLDSDKPPQN